MNITSKNEYKCSVSAEASYTSFEWSLHNWSLLYEYYKKDFKSPEFEIMQTGKDKCALRFSANHFMNKDYYCPKTILKVDFFSEFSFHNMQAKVSIIGKNMQKLCAVVESEDTKIVGNPLVLIFDQVLEKESAIPYLEDDTLKLFFELYVVKAIVQSPVHTSSTWHPNFKNMSRDRIIDMFKNCELCDFAFIVRKKLIHVHKLVLAANSDFFRVMFQSEVQEKKVRAFEIDDVNADVFTIFVNFMYTGDVEQMEEVVTDLIVVADKYKVIDLIKVCETYMMSHLQIENATQYLLLAHRHHLPSLKKEAINFMKQNTQVFADPAEYKLLSDYPSLITQIFE